MQPLKVLLLSGVIVGGIFLFWKYGKSTSETVDPTALTIPNQQPPPAPKIVETLRSPAAPVTPNGENNSKKESEPFDSFKRLTDRALQTLPTKAELQHQTAEEAHHPHLLLEKTAVLGEIAAALQADPRLARPAFSFYQQCAETEDFATSVRARCLSHLRRLSGKLGVNIDLSRFPADVRRLSDFAP